MGGEQSEYNFCEAKSLSVPILRMTNEAKVCTIILVVCWDSAMVS